jgi:hypothetical protein
MYDNVNAKKDKIRDIQPFMIGILKLQRSNCRTKLKTRWLSNGIKSDIMHKNFRRRERGRNPAARQGADEEKAPLRLLRVDGDPHWGRH